MRAGCRSAAILRTFIFFALIKILLSFRQRQVFKHASAPFKVVVLTMNRPVELQTLLRSLEETDYLGDAVELEIRFDQSRSPADTLRVAKKFSFSHGHKRVVLSKQASGLAEAWYAAWQPDFTDHARSIILEDDIILSPDWYRWLTEAWNVYGDVSDLAGISLMRQVLVPALPNRQEEIVNDHEPFLYSLVGSIAFSPNPRVWREFITWRRSISPDFDVTTPGLVTSEWWNMLDKKHMWTQHFIYFTLCRDLYTMYVNLHGQMTIASHVRAKGEHYDKNYGPDFVTAPSVRMDFPRKLNRYTWDASKVQLGALNHVTMDLLNNTLAHNVKILTKELGFVHFVVFREGDYQGLIRLLKPNRGVMVPGIIVLGSDLQAVRLLLRENPTIQSFWVPPASISGIASNTIFKLKCTFVDEKHASVSFKVHDDEIFC